MACADPAVVARGLAKTFRTGWRPRRVHPALQGVGFTVPRGTIFGILGPNGAGKTTLLSILATLLTPDEGRAEVLGLDVVRDASRVRERINLSSGSSSFLWSLSPREVLEVAARTYGLRRAERTTRIAALLDRFELLTHADLPYNELSTGLRQRLALAKAFVNDPELLILDEPTVGLDPDVSVRVREQIVALRSERRMTILLSTHYMREAEQLCDEVVFLRAGRILAQGDPGRLRRQITSGDRVVLAVEGDAVSALAGLPGVLSCRGADGLVDCLVDDVRRRLAELLRRLESRGVAVHDVEVAETTLESVFIELAR